MGKSDFIETVKKKSLLIKVLIKYSIWKVKR